MSNAILKIDDLTKQYKDKFALNSFSIEINKGARYAIIGPNGAGKTTLIRIIMGLSDPTNGSICIFGKTDEEGLSEARKKIGTLIEYPTFYKTMSAFENLEINRKLKNINDKNRSKELLELVGLENNKKKVKDFSLGMKQRLGIAKALMSHPEFLILDEPTNGLDPIGIIDFRNLIMKLNSEGITILICSHILKEMEEIATNFGIIKNGKMIKQLSIDEIHNNDNICMKINTDSPEKLSELIEKTFELKSKINGNNVYVYNSPKDLTGGKLVKKISDIDDKINIYEFSRNTETLEDYFKTTIGNSLEGNQNV